MTTYANLPGILGALMSIAVILGGDPDRFNPYSSAPTNIGFFLNPLETSRPLLAFAGSIDLVTIWVIVLLGIGFSEASGRKVSSVTVSLTYGGLWLAWVLGRVGLAMLM